MKRTQGVLLSALVLLAGFNPALAEEKRAGWDMGRLPVLAESQTRALFGFSALSSVNDDFSFTVTKPVNTFQSILAPCSNFNNLDLNYTACIETVSYRRVGSDMWRPAELGTVQLGNPTATISKPGSDLKVGRFEYQPANFRPDGDKSSVWNMPGAKHVAGSNYLVRAAFFGGTNSTTSADGGLALSAKLELLPISYPAGESIDQRKILVQEFPNSYEYKVRLKLGVFVKSLTGWFFGRLNNPTIDRNGPQGFLEVTGEPARIPIGITDVINSNSAAQYFDSNWCSEARTRCLFNEKLFDKAYVYTVEEKADPGLLSRWESVPGGVRTVATQSKWSLDSSSFNSEGKMDDETRACIQAIAGPGARLFQGAVVSNATLFQTTPPTWDAANSAFTFKVAAPHLNEKGLPNKGTYTLYIPIEQANCRWGSDASAARASIQVIDESGQASVTTSTATVENGTLRFNIAGFGYSSPTIKIKMGEGSFLSTPIKKSITCTKGKISRKIIAAKPSCPKGFKKVG